ncbi:MAG: hypothetical protein JJE25_14620 [Bacteroidia bacterium]|nr:hypothetical protein [Bacteroidia bacterium]
MTEGRYWALEERPWMTEGSYWAVEERPWMTEGSYCAMEERPFHDRGAPFNGRRNFSEHPAKKTDAQPGRVLYHCRTGGLKRSGVT